MLTGKPLFFLLFYSLFSMVFVSPKTAILIPSTGRCGSSCLSGVLQIMGVDFGNNLAGAPAHNPKGIFESSSTNRMIYTILKEVGINPICGKGPFYPLKIIDWDKIKKSKYWEDKIKKYIEDNFSQHDIFAIKYSPLAFALPLYISAVKKLGYTPKLIIPIREPNEVVTSWQKLHPNLSNYTSDLHIMIAKTFMHILRYVKNEDYLVISFDNLLNNTQEVVNELYSFIPGLKTFNECKLALDEFLDKNLKHENS